MKLSQLSLKQKCVKRYELLKY